MTMALSAVTRKQTKNITAYVAQQLSVCPQAPL